jgi:hypothetical protein
MTMNRILLIVAAVVMVGIGFYFIAFVLPFKFVDKEKLTNELECRDKDRALKEDVVGVLTKKFRDNKSHMWETIEYSNSGGSHSSILFLNDRSGAFDFIMPGDSIVKSNGNLELNVTRKGEKRKYQLNYGCE